MSNVEYKWSDDFNGNVGIIATTIGAQGSAGAYDTIDISGSYNWNHGAYSITTGATGQSYYTNSSYPSKVEINTNGIDIKNGADIKIGERSLSDFMDKVDSRLAILQPKPELLEKFEALQQAYEHYKLLEALCTGDIPNAPDHV